MISAEFDGLGILWEYEDDYLFDGYELLREYGYAENMDVEKVNRVAVTEKLQELCTTPSVWEEEPILWWNREREEEQVFLVYPVMLSLLLKEYECTEKLIEMGYCVDDSLLKEQVYLHKRDSEEKLYTICIQQILIAQEDIPERLLHKICKELEYIMPTFFFKRDYWENPFLKKQRGKLPCLSGLKRLAEENREILCGMLEELDTIALYEMRGLEKEEKNRLVKNLLWCFEGMEDMVPFLKYFSPKSFMIGEQWLTIWIRLLPKLKESCSYTDTTERAFFEHIARFLHWVLQDKDCLPEEKRKSVITKLIKLYETSCPEEYSIGDYIDFLVAETNWTVYTDYLKLWKNCLKRSVAVDRLDAALWRMIDNIFGEKTEDEEVDFNNREYNRELRLQQGIAFMEQLDEIEDSEQDAEANGVVLANLFSDIMDFESEELLLACLRNKLVIQEALPILIQCAFHFNKLRLIPVLILYQNKECA